MADFVGNSRRPTDFELLWDSDEDGFWEYFSKFEEESRTVLACNPRTLERHVTNTTDMDFARDEHDW